MRTRSVAITVVLIACLVALGAQSAAAVDDCWECKFIFWVGEEVCDTVGFDEIGWVNCEMPEYGGCWTYPPFCEVIIVS